MGTAKKLVNITISLEAMRNLGLSIEEYAVASLINQQMTNPESIANGWCLISKKPIT